MHNCGWMNEIQEYVFVGILAEPAVPAESSWNDANSHRIDKTVTSRITHNLLKMRIQVEELNFNAGFNLKFFHAHRQLGVEPVNAINTIHQSFGSVRYFYAVVHS